MTDLDDRERPDRDPDERVRHRDDGPGHDPHHRPVTGRRRAGIAMCCIAAAGLVTSVVASLFAWQSMGQMGSSVDRSLRLGEEALGSVDATLDVAEDAFAAFDQGLGTVADTLDAVAAMVDESAGVSSAAGILASDVAPSIERVDRTLATLQDLTGSIDAALRQLSQLPIGPTYDPETSLDATIGDIRADLTPIAESLRSAGEELDGFATQTDTLRAETSQLAADVAELQASLAGTSALLDAYRTTAAEALELAAESRRDLDDETGRARLAIVLVGTMFAVAQFVPAWLGRELLQSSSGSGRLLGPPPDTDAPDAPDTPDAPGR